MSRIVDNQDDINDGLEHLNMVDIFKEYHDDSNDFRFHVGTGFFFIDGFGELYDLIDIDKLNYGSKKYQNLWGTKAPILILMGKETNQTTKEALLDAENMVKYALNVHDGGYLEFLERLIEKGLIKFKVFTDKVFHAKIYFFYDGDSIDDIYVGSANLTSAGLKRNVELTAPMNTTKPLRKAHVKWFNNLWERATDDLNVLEIIKTYKSYDFIYYEPKKFFENLIRLMDKEYLFYNSHISENTLLVKFQSFDFYQVMSTLTKYNGCILASSVGLGKSYVALEVMRYIENNNMEALLIGPSGLVKGKDSLWNGYLKSYDLNVERIGYGELQQADFDPNKYLNYDLVVIDEAHNLRNPSNRRKNMIELIKNSPNAKYLLVTATPINVKISDLNSLIDLFYEVNRDKWLNKELKVKYETFKTKVNKLEKENGESKELLEEVTDLQEYIEKELIVKSTRSMVKEYFSEDLIKLAGTDEIPEPNVFSETYTYPQEYTKFFEGLPDFLVSLNYEHAKFHKEEDSCKYVEDRNLIYLYKWVLYKRAESSIYAFYTSIKNTRERINIYICHLDSVMKPEDLGYSVNSEFKERLKIAATVFDNFESDEKREMVIKNMREDAEKISKVMHELEKLKKGFLFENDSKLERLKEMMRENQDKKCLIFTEYFATLEYLTKNLEKDFSVDYVAGQDFEGNSMKPATKEKKLRRFKNNKFQHLISTDVLAEGFNLPEADIVINYDLPYNPVKMIQRVGRATRIDKPKKIEIRNFKPDESIDQELKLIECLDMRIHNIINMIGIDYSIWSETEELVKKKEKKDRANKCEVLKELKERIATEDPEEIYKIQLREESKLDMLLKKSIEHYNLKEEDIPVKKPVKPIYTTLVAKDDSFYGLYNFDGDYYESGKPAEFIAEPLKPLKGYNANDIQKFCDVIKRKYMNILDKKEGSNINNTKDKEILNKLFKIKKRIIPLKSTINKVINTKLYTNFKIAELIKEEIYPEIMKDGFIWIAQTDKINKWKTDLETILDEEGAEEISYMDAWSKDPEEYKKTIKAFIQYRRIDSDV